MPGEKVPPFDVRAEEAVIGSLLLDGSSFYKIASFLEKEHFFQEQNQWLYAASLELYRRSEAINQITLAQELDRQGKLEACGGAAYLSQLIANCETPLDLEHYARIVQRLALSRRLIEAARQIEAIGYEANPDMDFALNKAEDVLFRIRHGQSSRDFVHIRQVLDKYFEPSAAAGESADGTIVRVLSSYTSLDEFLGGFQRSDLTIVAGRPSMGKTSFTLSIAANAAIKQGACVALFSLEMAREPLAFRMLASEAGIDSRRVQFVQRITEEDKKRMSDAEKRRAEVEEGKIMNAIGILSEAAIYIDDSPLLRVAEMRGKTRRLFHEHGVDMVIVDYLQLMQGEGRDEVEKTGHISRSLKGLAREFNVPVIAVSQMSRAVEGRTSHKPQLSDLRGSGSIEQDADVVLFIYRDDYYYKKEEWEALHPGEEYPEGIADIIVAKHRNGPTGEIKFHFARSSARFTEIASQEPSLL